MRRVLNNVALTAGQILTSETCHSGGRNKQGFRLFDGILRVVNDGADTATVVIRQAFTLETLDALPVAGGATAFGPKFPVSTEYVVEVNTVGAGGALITAFVDGDEGRAPEYTIT